jgi:hypothetical protein
MISSSSSSIIKEIVKGGGGGGERKLKCVPWFTPQILKLLIQHGGQLKESEGRDCMSAAIQHKEFRLAEQLMELGVPPQHLSLEKGDTPLHAALTIALDKDKGWCKAWSVA